MLHTVHCKSLLVPLLRLLSICVSGEFFSSHSTLGSVSKKLTWAFVAADQMSLHTY